MHYGVRLVWIRFFKVRNHKEPSLLSLLVHSLNILELPMMIDKLSSCYKLARALNICSLVGVGPILGICSLRLRFHLEKLLILHPMTLLLILLTIPHHPLLIVPCKQLQKQQLLTSIQEIFETCIHQRDIIHLCLL